MIKYSTLPLITICVLVYNRELYLEECLESVINQTYANLEILIVYNKSTDNSLNIIKQYEEKDSRIKVLYLEEKFESGFNSKDSIELAYNNATGEFVGNVDSDDYITLDCIEKCFNVLNQDINLDKGLVYTYCRMFGNVNQNCPRARQYRNKESLLDYFSVFHFRLFRNSLWKEIKELSNTKFYWDYDLVLRLSEICDFVLIKENLYFWRKHNNQISSNNDKLTIYKDLEICRNNARRRRGLIT